MTLFFLNSKQSQLIQVAFMKNETESKEGNDLLHVHLETLWKNDYLITVMFSCSCTCSCTQGSCINQVKVMFLSEGRS